MKNENQKSNYIPLTPFPPKAGPSVAGQGGLNSNGVALVAVLAVLVVLAILAASFVAFTSLEQRASEVNINKFQADMFAESGLEHFLSQLWYDSVATPAWDSLDEPWNSSFVPRTKNPQKATDVDGLTKAKLGGSAFDARWNYVHNPDGSLAGRYAILVEDETGKINVNSAAALSEKMQNEGVGTFENLLTDGKKRGLPFSIKFAKNILRYRYGRDLSPGQRDVDDNLTASSYAADEIDNNANGIVDEKDEGIDEQEEYSSENPRWDDRVFPSINDVVNICSKGEVKNMTPYKYLKRHATVNSKSSEVYWDDEAKTFMPRINLNTATRKQLHKVFARANAKNTFTSAGRNLRMLVANTLDYRDENHVLSTVGSEYGVEAVCFNEVMANEGSYSMEAEGFQPDSGFDRFTYMHRFGIWYNPDKEGWQYGYKIKRLGLKGGPANVLTNGVKVKVPNTIEVEIDDEPIRPVIRDFKYRDFLSIKKSLGGIPRDLWKNGWLMVFQGKDASPEYIYYPIIGNEGDVLAVGYDNTADYTLEKLQAVADPENRYNSCRIDNLWRNHYAAWCVFPRMNDLFSFPTQYDEDIKPKSDLYYYLYVGEQNFEENVPVPDEYPFQGVPDYPYKGYNRYMDVDGNATTYSQSKIVTIKEKDLKGSSMQIPGGKDKIEMLKWAYKDGKPVRAKNGFINMVVGTGKDTGYVDGMKRHGRTKGTDSRTAFLNKNCFDVVYIMRPDIIELINISDKPISLRNWKVVINTGSYADQVALIEDAVHYSMAKRGKFIDPNPAIDPGGYFYLSNKRDIFSIEYGGYNNENYGISSSQQYPCYELPDFLWGVRYEITGVRENRLTVKNARWKKDQMKFEMIEIQPKRVPSNRNGAYGMRKSVYQSGRNTLDAQHFINWEIDGVEVGDDLLILGMPRQGGFLSMTLKNEYNQIVARTIDYGSVDIQDLNNSTEKYDPTHYNWVKTRKPTFGGNKRKAENKSYRQSSLSKPHIKNNRMSSLGEIRKVRSADDWENIGGAENGAKILKSIGDYFTVSGIRLDPEEKGTHIKGWVPAFGQVAYSKRNGAVAKDVSWEPNIWVGHTLRILSGNMKSEKFPVISSTENSLITDGFSTPGSKQLKVAPGDEFSVGPGYSTSMYYSRKNNEEGIWEWQNQNLEKRKYGLYLFGLNDSIRTTEFLEENFNAKMNVYVYNFKENKYDKLPLLSEKAEEKGRKDIYGKGVASGNFQYEKNDGVFCGMILPAHISSKYGIRLKIVPHNLDNKNGSGFAWFDYAYLAPGHVRGKININTASARVLSSLNGVTPEIAKNIKNGVVSGSKNRIKHYKNITDILNVKGVAPELYGKICNLIETRSDQFRVQVLAETLSDVNKDGKFDQEAGDKVLAQSRIDKIVDRSNLTDKDSKNKTFSFLR